MSDTEKSTTNGQQQADVVPPNAGEIVKHSFGESSLARSAETASSAAAAQAVAIIQARYVMAERKPRDIDEVRQRLLKDCRRPAFAKVARYRKPVGRGIEGPSIRFAESAMRCMTNMVAETMTVFDDASKRVIRVSVTDLESNVPYSQDVVIDKTVERSKVPDGQEPLGVRTNSRGQRTYLIAATEDDLLNKQNAIVSKALRTLILRIVPGDLIEEGMQAVLKTQQDEDARDPDAARKGLVDGFANIGISVQALKDYLGHEVSAATLDELRELRALGLAIQDGEANWKDALSAKKAGRGGSEEKPAGGVKDRVTRKAQEAKEVKAPATTTPTPAPTNDGRDDAAAEAALGREPGQEG